MPFFQQIVPTVDTVRYQFLITTLIHFKSPVLLVGPVGTGKTSVAENTVNRLSTDTYSILTVSLSAQVRYFNMYIRNKVE